MSIRVPLTVKMYIYEVLFFDDFILRNEFLSLSEDKRREFVNLHTEIDVDYFESDSIDSLNDYLSVHPFKDCYFINPKSEFSCEVNL